MGCGAGTRSGKPSFGKVKPTRVSRSELRGVFKSSVIYEHYPRVDQGVVGRVPEAQLEVVDADHRGQQVLPLAAVDNN